MDYKEKLEEAKKLYEIANPDQKYVLESLFPELSESEDEKIRKALINQFSDYKRRGENHGFGYSNDKILAWLKKQGEHANFRNKIQIGDKVTRNEDGMLVNLSQLKRIAKPAENKGKNNMGISEDTKKKLENNLNKALEKETPESCNEFLKKQGEKKSVEWSEKDEQYLLICKNALNKYQVSDQWDAAIISRWLEDKVKSSVQQPKQEWSEEDKMMLQYAIEHFERQKRNCVEGGGRKKAMQEFIDWLKSLRPQSHWKPSDEQMKALDDVISSRYIKYDVLSELWKDLRKLKG